MMENGPAMAAGDMDETEDGLNLGFLDAMDDEEVLALSQMIGPVWDRLQKAIPQSEIGEYAAFGALVELVRELATEVDQNDSDVEDDEVED